MNSRAFRRGKRVIIGICFGRVKENVKIIEESRSAEIFSELQR